MVHMYGFFRFSFTSSVPFLSEGQHRVLNSILVSRTTDVGPQCSKPPLSAGQLWNLNTILVPCQQDNFGFSTLSLLAGQLWVLHTFLVTRTTLGPQLINTILVPCQQDNCESSTHSAKQSFYGTVGTGTVFLWYEQPCASLKPPCA